MTNTPAFLESIYGIVAGGAVIVPVNYRLKEDDISYIFNFSEVDIILADWEFVHLLQTFKTAKPGVKIVIDTVSERASRWEGLCFVFVLGEIRVFLIRFDE